MTKIFSCFKFWKKRKSNKDEILPNENVIGSNLPVAQGEVPPNVISSVSPPSISNDSQLNQVINDAIVNPQDNACVSINKSAIISSSEQDLLQCIRLERESLIRPEGIPFNDYIDNKPIVRIASWNLKNLSPDKISNPGVMLVICLTILENKLSFIVLQEVTHPDVAHKIVEELNNPTQTKIKHHSQSHFWQCSVSEKRLGKIYGAHEYGVVIYDKSRQISILKTNVLTNSTKSFVRSPYFVDVKIRNEIFLIVIFHLKCTDMNASKENKTINEISDLAVLAKLIKEMHLGRKIIFIGDFNMGVNHESFQSLSKEGFIYLIDPDICTNTSQWISRSYDNIWVDSESKLYFTGLSGVIHGGLCHPFIPKLDLKGWGGCVSDHCPVWADIFTSI